VIGVRAIQKPCFTRCPNQAEPKGCAIYANQPRPCSDYQCSWLKGELSDDQRPDLLGVIVDEGLSAVFKPLWGDDARVAREIAPGSARSPRAAAVIASFTTVFVKTYGGGSPLMLRGSRTGIL
jgi:Fe-S-cluster containining protein